MELGIATPNALDFLCGESGDMEDSLGGVKLLRDPERDFLATSGESGSTVGDGLLSDSDRDFLVGVDSQREVGSDLLRAWFSVAKEASQSLASSSSSVGSSSSVVLFCGIGLGQFAVQGL